MTAATGRAAFPRPDALYVHVPFCPVICPYCDFHKMRRNEPLVAAYMNAVVTEAAALAQRYPGPLATIYLGGGTPSHLTDAELDRLVAVIAAGWGWPARQETTIEADPLTFDAARAHRLRGLGFDRISVGLQSTQDAALTFLGRRHSGIEGLRAVDDALAAGFDVTVDLMAAVPGQDLARDLDAVIASGVDHVSVYSLTVEPHTPFSFAGVVTNVDRDADDFELTRRVLDAAGFGRYEVSNHARPGHESRHNQVYWRGDYYLALGPGATAFLPEGPAQTFGTRRTAPQMKAWLAQPVATDSAYLDPGWAGTTDEPARRRGRAKGEVEIVDPHRWVEDVLMTGLRTTAGANLTEIRRRSGIDVAIEYADRVATLAGQGMVRLETGFGRASDGSVGIWSVLDPVLIGEPVSRLVATNAGLMRLNAVVTELLWGSGETAGRPQAV